MFRSRVMAQPGSNHQLPAQWSDAQLPEPTSWREHIPSWTSAATTTRITHIHTNPHPDLHTVKCPQILPNLHIHLRVICQSKETVNKSWIHYPSMGFGDN